MKCWRCDGSGSINVRFDNDLGWVSRVCPICHGTGKERISNQDVLILVNVQNGFINELTEPIVSGLINFLADYKFSKVFATKFFNCKDSMFIRELANADMISLSSRELFTGIQPYVSSIFLIDSYRCLSDGFLRQIKILNNGELPEHVLLAGFDTETFVMSAAAGLFDAGIKPIVLADFTGSSKSTENHLSGLLVLESMFGKGSILRLG